MPLGLKFLPTPKKLKDKTKISEGTELKSLSDPLLNLSIGNDSAGFICKSESVHIFQGLKAYSDAEDIKIAASAEILSVEESSNDTTTQDEETEPVECTPIEIPEEMTSSFFDRNGNPVDDEEDPPPPAPIRPEPKCFINAAQLVDEEPEYVPTPPPSLLFQTLRKSTEPVSAPDLNSTSPKGKVSPCSSGIPIRRRVPISKSFPDIIQTTIQPRRDENESDVFNFKVIKGQDPMEECLMVADSLEEIRIQPPLRPRKKSIDLQDGPSTSTVSQARVFDRIEPVLTGSILGNGIMSEKLPETWIVDFSSFTSEDDEQKLRERRKSTSSTNSLSYFLSMDEVDTPVGPGATQRPEDQLTASTDSTGSKKMIFSMFVDLSGKDNTKPIVAEPSPRKVDSNLRLKALRSGIPRYPHPPCPTGVKGGHDSKMFGNPGGSMSSSMMMSSVSDTEMSQFQGISNRSSLHVANHEHDGSFTSSILSSMEMSTVDGSDVCQGGPCFKLGMDLLRMFQESINTDVTISVRGRFVKAHKCILASRSQYFAAILSGNWIHKAGNTIHLDEFSYNTVQFTMYHIYSGTNEIPETIDLMELAMLTDMLGLEGLKEVISQTIRNRFCHNFHRPCTGCIAGILEFFPLAVNNGMEELQKKMTKWICKHFVRIWPTKAFANLGDSMIEKCLGFSITHLSPENLLDVTLGCDQLITTMPTVRWTEVVFSTVNKLNDACVHYIGDHLSEVLQSQRFLLFGKGQTWNISRIENTFFEGIVLLKADEACLSHVALCRLIELGTVTIDEVEWSTIFVNFLKILRRDVEKFLLGNASKAVLSRNWELLSQEVRKRICATSFHGSEKTKKPQMKSVPPASVTPVPAPRKSSAQSPSTAAQTQVKHAETSKPTVTTKNLESPGFQQNRIPSPVPIAESAQKWTSTKSVASVRPMQSQPQTPVAAPAPPVPTPSKTPNVYSSKKTAVSNTGTWTKNDKSVKSSTSTVSAESIPRRKFGTGLLEKERSFDTTSSRVSSAGSATTSVRRGSVSRSVMTKPPVPSHKTASPLEPVSQKSKPLAVKASRKPSTAVPEPPPTKTTFLTNSEKAKAVSKPKLVFRNQRSNSVATPPLSPIPADLKAHNRQGSMGSVGQTGSTSSRYVSNKPKTNSEKTIKAPASPSLQRSRMVSNTPKLNDLVTGRDTRATMSGHGTGTYRISRGRTGNVRGKNEVNQSGRSRNTSGMDTSWQMSKSSIEMDSDGCEPKMRTLAEIGRSSTFSKDEPTVLGKMDVSMDYDVN